MPSMVEGLKSQSAKNICFNAIRIFQGLRDIFCEMSRTSY